jgi:hypothetical protein
VSCEIGIANHDQFVVLSAQSQLAFKYYVYISIRMCVRERWKMTVLDKISYSDDDDDDDEDKDYANDSD